MRAHSALPARPSVRSTPRTVGSDDVAPTDRSVNTPNTILRTRTVERIDHRVLDAHERADGEHEPDVEQHLVKNTPMPRAVQGHELCRSTLGRVAEVGRASC